MPDFVLHGGEVLRGGAMALGDLTVTDGVISEGDTGRRVDLREMRVLPGIVDIHGDGFERHLAPRRGAMRDLSVGLASAEAELAANGITTAVLAQFWSWEGGMRGPAFARRFLAALATYSGLGTDLRVQLRFETHMLDDYAAVEEVVAEHDIGYLVFNDHLPHAALAAGKRPPRLTGQALKGGRSPEAHLAMMQKLADRSDGVAAALPKLAARLAARGVVLGSHDDSTEAARIAWRGQGVCLSEFPESRAAAVAARSGGDGIVLGAPNVVRGGSHSGHVSAVELVQDGLCDALASDYHYPAPRQAALTLAEEIGLPASWTLISDGPARMLGMADRGTLDVGKRADLVVLDGQGRVGATLAAGRITYLAGDVAERFLA